MTEERLKEIEENFLRAQQNMRNPYHFCNQVGYCECGLTYSHETMTQTLIVEVKRLSKDRRAFSQETQFYRQAWLKDQETIARLKSGISHIISMAGNPDAAEGCRLIIKRVREALDEEPTEPASGAV